MFILPVKTANSLLTCTSCGVIIAEAPTVPRWQPQTRKRATATAADGSNIDIQTASSRLSHYRETLRDRLLRMQIVDFEDDKSRGVCVHLIFDIREFSFNYCHLPPACQSV